jgi:hypothetical protein
MAAAKVSLLLQLPTAPPTIPLLRQCRRRHLPITIAMASSSSSDSPKQIVVGTYRLLPSLLPIPLRFAASCYRCFCPPLKCWYSICRSQQQRSNVHHCHVQLGCGGISTDYLATVASFPNPDDKIRSLALKVQGGGNVGNALTAAAHLGLAPRVISKVRPFSFSLFPPQFFLTKSPRLVVVASNDKSSQFESYLDQVSNDSMGRIILPELQSDGVDASYMVVCITFPYLNSTVIVTQ